MEVFEDLVLIPGLLNNEKLWTKQIQGLEDMARVHVACTMGGDESTVHMAQRILDEAPFRFSLGGLSMGGYIALEIMKIAPERVNRLALLNTQAQMDTKQKKAIRRQIIAASQTGKFVGASKPFMKKLLSKEHCDNAEIVGVIQEMAMDIGLELFIKQQTAIMNREDKMYLLPEIKQPTLMIMGTEDEIIPKGTNEAMAEIMPNVRYEVLENCGHMSALERPDTVTQMMREWLRTY